jgi:ATP-binding cassette, subfamily B, bacterial CvaB/MchF/RaxB
VSGQTWPWSRRLRPVLQAEAAECGLACLTMIAAYHGHQVDLPGLRRLHPISNKGITLEALMTNASAMNLSPRALRLELDELPQLQTPAILHWDLAHFVVLEAADRASVTILDPAEGRRRLSLKEADRHFTGVALELTPTGPFQPIQARSRIRLTDLWSRIANWGGAAAQIVGLSVLLQLTVLLMPFFLQLTIDEAIGAGNPDLLTLLLVGFGLVYALNAVIAGLRSWVLLTVGESMSFQLGGNVVRHLIRLPVAFFERRHVGDLMSRIGSIEPVKDLLTQGVVNAVIDALLAVTTLVVMALISPSLALIVLATTAVYIAIWLLAYPTLRRRTEEEIVARARQETHLMETMRAMRAIKIHSHETLRENAWRNHYAEVISASYRAAMVGIRVDLAETLLFALQFLLIVYVGALAVLSQQLTIGLLLAFIAYRHHFTGSASALVEQIQRWRLVGVHLDRLSDIVAEPAEPLIVARREHLLPPPAVKAEGLSFRYAPAEPPIFEDLAIDIPAGAMAAIVGPSGAGKTTLMRVMLGLLEPSAGRLLADGAPLTPANASAWRSRLGAVMQDDHLLTGTLADNIAFFDPQLDFDRVETAARLACIHDDIARMPMRYHSLVGDMGAALSAGQRQRLLLARALYRDPDILFLDEGTANLDPETETAIADMITALPITRIIIAHRPALIERADLVLRLEHGAIAKVPQPTGRPKRAFALNQALAS